MSEDAPNAKEALLEPVKSAIESRLSPFVVSFVISWCLWNWEFLAMMVGGGGTMAWRIWFAKEHYLSPSQCVFFPLLSAFAIQPAAIICGYGVSIASHWAEELLLERRHTQEKDRQKRKVAHELRLKQQAANLEFSGSPARLALEQEASALRNENERMRISVKDLTERLHISRKLAGESAALLDRLFPFKGDIRMRGLIVPDDEFVHIDRMVGELTHYQDNGELPERLYPRAFGG